MPLGAKANVKTLKVVSKALNKTLSKAKDIKQIKNIKQTEYIKQS